MESTRNDHEKHADPEKLVHSYNTLRLLLDRHAPIMSKKVLFRPKVPWINSDIIEAKRGATVERTNCEFVKVRFQPTSSTLYCFLGKINKYIN